MSEPTSHLSFPLEKATTLVDDVLHRFDDGELFIGSKTTDSLSLRDGMIKTASSSTSQGFGLRGLCGEATLYAAQTLSSMGLSGTHIISLDEVKELVSPVSSAPRILTPQVFPFDHKVKLLQDIGHFARNLDSRVIQVSAELGESFQRVWILRLGGQIFPDQRLRSTLMLRLTVEQQGRREHGAVRVGGRTILLVFWIPLFGRDMPKRLYGRRF